MDSVDATALLELATEIAHEAGTIIADGLGRRREFVGTKSSATDMVTEVDRASEALIVRRIIEQRPEDEILGEEGSARPGTSGLRWVIDPLDGTTNFLYGFPAFAVSIAVEDASGALVGVVFDAARGETFAAARGKGATRDGAPIAVSALQDVGTALAGTGFGYSAARRQRQAAIVAGVLPHIRDIRRAGSAALDLCSVACGRLDTYFEQGIQHWDHAAGALIVQEAGGRVGWLTGEGFDPPMLLAAGPALFEPMSTLLRDAAEG